MKRFDYAYCLGAVSYLERKIISPKRFFEFLSYSLEGVLSEVKGSFFQSLSSSYQSIGELENFLNKEQEVLDRLTKEWIWPELFEEFKNFFVYTGVNEPLLKGYPFLLNLFKIRLDFFNIVFLLRAGYLKRDFSVKFLGDISEEDLNKLFKQDEILKIKMPLHYQFFTLGSSLVREEKYYLLDFIPFKFLFKLQEEAKKVILGPERVFSFYFLKRLQDKILKLIFISKLYNLEEERIREILEVVYG
ncbi:MAG: hypothetical protein J7K37_05630 [Candidatus Omnitrophica bacterium]|nr:hypothetical protein [Candidatus Omnitrophota bacterium]